MALPRLAGDILLGTAHDRKNLCRELCRELCRIGVADRLYHENLQVYQRTLPYNVKLGACSADVSGLEEILGKVGVACS